MDLLQTGIAAIGEKFSIIPIDKATKKPLFKVLPLLYDDGMPVMKLNQTTGELFHSRGWKPYQSEIASEQEVRRWIAKDAQLAVVCGKVSGGLLIIDFDVPRFFGRWYRRVAKAGFPVEGLVIQRTGGGGWQVLVCCDNPGENTKLAWVKDDTQKSGRSVAIETRGEGGYAVIAPSLHRVAITIAGDKASFRPYIAGHSLRLVSY